MQPANFIPDEESQRAMLVTMERKLTLADRNRKSSQQASGRQQAKAEARKTGAASPQKATKKTFTSGGAMAGQ